MFSRRFVLLLLLCFSAQASANIVNLGLAQNFNLFAINNFTSSASDVQGAVAVGGNMTVSNYAVNSMNTPGYAGNALVVNGNLNFTNGSIGQGNAYVGGSTSALNVGFAGGSFQAGVAPFSFADTANSLYQLSATLSGLSANGVTSFNGWGGVTFTGDGTGNTQIFNVNSAQLSGINNLSLANVLAGQSVILNISGSNVAFSNAGVSTLGANVLFNFNQATQIAFNGVGGFGSLLAPYATVTGTGAMINGSVVVNNWLSNIQVNSGGVFLGASIPGSVPEPATLALLVLGLMALQMRRSVKSGAVYPVQLR
jgi:choice-of-anchor A domain-containing protein